MHRRAYLPIGSGMALALSAGVALADWNGPYVGLTSGTDLPQNSQIIGGGQIGYAQTFGSGWVVGGELMVLLETATGDGLGVLQVRLGVEASPDFLIFGTAGVGAAFPGTDAVWSIGIGVEYAFNDNWSLRADHAWYGAFSTGPTERYVTLGLSYHF